MFTEEQDCICRSDERFRKAIGSLSDAQKKKGFGNGTKWMNLEVIYPQTANVIDYDVAELYLELEYG